MPVDHWCLRVGPIGTSWDVHMANLVINDGDKVDFSNRRDNGESLSVFPSLEDEFTVPMLSQSAGKLVGPDFKTT